MRAPDAPVRLQDVINKALEKDRDLRFQSAAEIRAELKRIKRDASSGTGAASSGPSAAHASSASGQIGASALHSAVATPTPTRRPRALWSLGLVATLAPAGSGRLLGLPPIRRGCESPARRDVHASDAADAKWTTRPRWRSLLTDATSSTRCVKTTSRVSGSVRWPRAATFRCSRGRSANYHGLLFTPDGNYVYFVRSDASSRTRTRPLFDAGARRNAATACARCRYRGDVLARWQAARVRARRARRSARRGCSMANADGTGEADALGARR